MHSEAPTAAVLIIGNEILSGRTPDSNLNAIALKLAEIGVRLLEARVVPDIEHEIVEAVNTLRAKYTYVLTTGGIGPTHDDITADAMGAAFGLPVTLHPEGKARLVAYYPPEKLNDSRLRMARTPEGAVLIDNPVSVAPGFRVENVYVLAGVPHIMRSMLDNVVAELKHGPDIHTISVSGHVAESTVGDELAEIAKRYPDLDIGSYPWLRNDRYGTALVTRGIDQAAVKQASDEIFALVKKHGGNPQVE
ncbi:MAG TPA: competence/damage-inducible protein A [Alphaproteobacteria bacterium]|nr:competence/damage-inducible protein A [Alphaproteobacteria bacterium]